MCNITHLNLDSPATSKYATLLKQSQLQDYAATLTNLSLFHLLAAQQRLVYSVGYMKGER